MIHEARLTTQYRLTTKSGLTRMLPQHQFHRLNFECPEVQLHKGISLVIIDPPDLNLVAIILQKIGEIGFMDGQATSNPEFSLCMATKRFVEPEDDSSFIAVGVISVSPLDGFEAHISSAPYSERRPEVRQYTVSILWDAIY